MQHSQLDPLPNNLPFRIASGTVGRGAYASIKLAKPLDAEAPVFAVKLVHKGYAIKHGRISAKQIAMEVSLHSHVGQHPNIIEWFATGEDPVWRWIAMEYAEGGDLFDKIEADVGVEEDVAHFYFLQLISGASFVHSKGVAHRDLKPENMLLSASGDLKIADFGMATMFEYKGQRKLSSTMCGSPPYIAPEVLACAKADRASRDAAKYSADLVDIWSCGVILFVLLVGNTPWDEPTSTSWEYREYVATSGRSSDALWAKLPPDALSLLRGMMSVDPARRFSLAQIRQHPWYTRHNARLAEDDAVARQLKLATQMLGSMRVDLTQEPTPSQERAWADAMDIDVPGPTAETGGSWSSKPLPLSDKALPASQPVAPIQNVLFDWERPTRRTIGSYTLTSTQPVAGAGAANATNSRGRMGHGALDVLADDQTMSQFSQAPGVPLSLTQHARRFRDIVPAYSLARFYSDVPPALLVQMLTDALHRLNVPVPAPTPVPTSGGDGDDQSGHVAALRIRALDGRRQSLHGEILVDRLRSVQGEELLEVQFVKVKGDPVEWRRFFKQVALHCKDAIYNDGR